MVVTPDTEIYLIRFDVTKQHQLTFDDIEGQLGFFKTLAENFGVSLSASTYQRKDNIIRFPAWIDEIEKYNYCFFNNPSYSNKWYYCYIEDMNYVNDGLTDVKIKVDVFQTYQFDFIYKSCFVEREHVNDDTRGLHTVPEGLETGEFVINSCSSIPELDEKIYFVKVNKDTSGTPQYGTTFGSLYSASGYYACRNYQAMKGLILDYEAGDIPNAVESAYVVPYAFFKRNMQDIIEKVPDSLSPYLLLTDVTKATSLDGYSPKNKKLLTGDYCYLMASNQSGGVYNYNYEDFKSDQCDFVVEGVPIEGTSMILTPLAYGTANGTQEKFYPFSLQGGKLPITDNKFDNYSIWLRNNMINIALANVSTVGQAGLGIGQIAGGIATGYYEQSLEGAGNIVSAFNRASELCQLKQEKAKLPMTTIGQVSNNGIMSANNISNFYFYKMSIKREYARIIDNFFSMFGYKVITTKVPNINGRRNWNYVKTTEAIVESNVVPEKYLEEFKQMLNSGITFWHDYRTFKDYSQNNDII